MNKLVKIVLYILISSSLLYSDNTDNLVKRDKIIQDLGYDFYKKYYQKIQNQEILDFCNMKINIFRLNKTELLLEVRNKMDEKLNSNYTNEDLTSVFLGINSILFGIKIGISDTLKNNSNYFNNDYCKSVSYEILKNK